MTVPAMTKAAIGLGSNLDDRLRSLQKGITGLALWHSPALMHPCVEVVAVSGVHETSPVGPDQPAYLNAVAIVRTTLTPHGLLEACLQVEADNGRTRTQHWGPRTLDLDILDIDGVTCDAPDLVVPHPWSHRRGFVLVPWAEVAPDWLHPATGTTVASLAAGIDRAAEGIVRRDDLVLQVPQP